MRDTYEKALAFTEKWEGWDSHIKGDPGGRTRLGIAEHFWPDAYIKIAIMNVEDAKVYAKAFYFKNFWMAVGCDSLPYPLDCVTFDCAVNPGPSWTRTNLKDAGGSWAALLNLRRQHYRNHPPPPGTFGGLMNRCADLERQFTTFDSMV